MIDLLEKNKEMLREGKYNVSDTRQLSRIVGLKNPNDYDKYLIVCALCNYDLPEIAELRDLRMQYFNIVMTSGIDYSHKDSDYTKVDCGIRCTNTGDINKYGHFVFEINTNDKNLVHELWSFKSKECLKYVDNKTNPNAIQISVSKEQFEAFKGMLDKLHISYDKKNLERNVKYSNKSTNKLVDISTLDLPFKPFPYQIEDAERILKTKRQLLGHEMGCVGGKSRVYIRVNGICRCINVQVLANSYNDKKTYEIMSLINGKYEYVKIQNILFMGKQPTIKLKTEDSSLECTQDHLIFTTDGWKPAMDLNVGDEIVQNVTRRNGKIVQFTDKKQLVDVCTESYIQGVFNNKEKLKISTNKITEIEQGETQDVYDILVENSDIHNFVCSNFVVHNCGKTLISILIGESINHPKLVVCPEALRINWYREIKRARNDADVQILYSSDDFHYGNDWTIVGYKTVTKFLPKLKRIKCLFVDECHNCKSVSNFGKPTSKRAESLLELAQSSEYCYLLSGTPVPSKNKDLFNILKMLKCDEYNLDSMWSFKNFADRYCDPKDNGFGKNYDGNSNSKELHSVLQGLMVRRLKKEVLPNLTKQRQFIPIEPKFKKDYKEIEYRLYLPRRDAEGKLLDTFLGLAMSGRQILSQYKLESAIELAETILNAEESVVIVTNFDETANKLKAYFKNEACEIRGGMNDKTRQLAIDDFQSKKRKVCILNMFAGGVGINLTAAHTMIVIDYVWNPSDMIQVEDRICRTGQTENCIIYYIYCDSSTLDSAFIDMLSSKAANTDLVVDDAASTFDLASEKEASMYLTYLEKIKTAVENDTYGLLHNFTKGKKKGG